MKTQADILAAARQIQEQLAANHSDLANKIRSIRMECSTRYRTKAGTASAVRNEIMLSFAHFCDENNFNSELRNTVTHEIAHILAPSFRIPGQRRRPHGPAWKAMHRRLGGNGERCHEMEVAACFQRKKRLFEVTCHKCCGSLLLGPTRVRRHYDSIKRGGTGYIHARCG